MLAEIDLNDYWKKYVTEMASKAEIQINGPNPWDIKVKNNSFYKLVVQEGSLGLGESYIESWWDCDELDVLFTKLLRSEATNYQPITLPLIFQSLLRRIINPQSKARAKIVGKEHYDLGNDLFSVILDPYMQYSCGYWKNASSLEEAQVAKLKLICEKLELKPNMSLLDIGCGWGGLAKFAASKYGVSVYGVTISAEQVELARKNCYGLDVKIELKDYRFLDGKFDRIVSVGMFEHVGPQNYSDYFEVVDNNLKSDGLFLLHTIGSNKTDCNLDPWFEKYIFPNGCLPSPQHISSSSEGVFIIEDWHNFGSDYDKTLMEWKKRFESSWHILSNKYSENFRRMFLYYLCSSAGASRARDIQLWQIIFTRGKLGSVKAPR